MAKRRVRRGWKKVEEFKHQMSGTKVGIYLNVSTSIFDAELDGVRYEAASIAELHQKLNSYLDERSGVEWMDVIAVDFPSATWRSERDRLGIEIDRMYVSGLMFDEKHLQASRRHGDRDTPEARLRDAKPLQWNIKELGEFKPPCANEDRDVIYVPYSEAMWNALEEVQKRIINQRKNLQIMLLEDDDGVRLDLLGMYLSYEHRAEYETKLAEIPELERRRLVEGSWDEDSQDGSD